MLRPKKCPRNRGHSTRSFGRNSFGLVTTTTTTGFDIPSRSTTVTYSADGRFPISLLNEKSHLTLREYDARFGTLTEETSPNLAVTTFDIDALGRVVTEFRPDGVSTITTYNLGSSLCGGPPISSAMWIDRTATNGDRAVLALDSLGRERCRRKLGFDGRWINEVTTYDPLGRVSFKSRPFFDGYMVYGITATYDSLDRVLTQTAGDGGVKLWAYNGLATTVTNAKNYSRVEHRDGRGLLLELNEPDQANAFYEYDALGNNTRLSDDAAVTVTTFDTRGNPLTVDDPDRGDHVWTYDSLGQLKSHTNAREQTTNFDYDVLGRMTTRSNANGSFAWEYDTAANGKGMVARVTGSGLSSNLSFERVHSYDSIGRPISQTVNASGQSLAMSSFTTSLTYSAVTGRVDTLSYPTGLVTRNIHGTDGYLRQVIDVATSAPIWEAGDLDAEDQVTAEIGGGVWTMRAFDPRHGRLISATSGSGFETAQSETYDWDVLGSLIMRSQAAGGASIYESFTYDYLNRLSSVTPGAGIPQSFVYSRSGNIEYNGSLLGLYMYGTTGGPRAVSQINTFLGTQYNFLYDDDGNQTSATLPGGRTRTATFAVSNRPASVISNKAGTFSYVEYAYGPEEEMIFQLTEETKPGQALERIKHLYVSSTFELAQTTTTGKTEFRSNIYAYGKLVAIRTQKKDTPTGPVMATSTTYPHMDHLGSVTSVSNSFGVIVDRTSFDAWGNRRAFGTSPGTEFATVTPSFTGHTNADLVGLVHMGGRAYDPVIGRFISADPFVQPPNSTQELNPYSYVLNNPVSAVDPTGLATFGSVQWFEAKLDYHLNNLKRFGRWLMRFTRHYGHYVQLALTIVAAVFAPYLVPAIVVLGGILQTAAYGDVTLQGIFLATVRGAASYVIGLGAAGFVAFAAGVASYLGGLVSGYLPELPFANARLDASEPVVPVEPPSVANGLPTTFADGAGIPHEVIEQLRPFFPDVDLSSIRMYNGLPWFASETTTRAFTWRDSIHFSVGDYNPNTVDGIALIAHEVQHVADFRALGAAVFAVRYGAEFAFKLPRHLFQIDSTYRSVSLEASAFATQRAVESHLSQPVLRLVPQ